MSRDTKQIQQWSKQRHTQFRQSHQGISGLSVRFMSMAARSGSNGRQAQSLASQVVKKSTSLRELARVSVKETLRISSKKLGRSPKPFGSTRGPSALGRRQVGSRPLVHRKEALEAKKQAELEQLHQALEVKLAALELLQINHEALEALLQMLSKVYNQTHDAMFKVEAAQVVAQMGDVLSEIGVLQLDIQLIQRQIAALSK